jgi:crossover junction endodeoxyribonuclease RuvC
MRVLGIDPGSVITGYGLVEDRGPELQVVAFGAIATRASASFPQRLLRIFRELRAVVADYRPDCAAVEAVFFAKNVQSALRLGQARGVALIAVAEAGIEVAEYAPREIKQAVTSYGQAGKGQVQEMVRILLRMPETPEPPDAADALAIAICHHQAARLAARIGKR